MLLEFTVGNFRSIRERQTLSLLASTDKQLSSENVFEHDGLRLLKSAVIYGANSSGKSNIIKAISFMRRQVLRFGLRRDTEVTETTGVEPFLLDVSSSDQPSHFEMVFFANKTQYRYGFEATNERVTEEWLYHVPQKREALLFRRKMGVFDLHGAFEKEAQDLQTRTRDSLLFLPVVAEFNGPIASSIHSWFLSLRVDSGLNTVGDSRTTEMLDPNSRSSEVREKVLDLLRGLSLGFDNVVLEQIAEERTGRLSENLGTDDTYAVFSRTGSFSKSTKTRALTVHRRNETGDEVLFDLVKQESAGTRRVYSLAGDLITVLLRGRVLVVDEMDARLHPIITRNLVRLFHSGETNPKNAQLVFVTHDTNLLTNRIFRRDQIWFVEKDQHQSSHLYSLAEFTGVRKDALFEKDYIVGRYGGIPFLGDLREMLSVSLSEPRLQDQSADPEATSKDSDNAQA